MSNLKAETSDIKFSKSDNLADSERSISEDPPSHTSYASSGSINQSDDEFGETDRVTTSIAPKSPQLISRSVSTPTGSGSNKFTTRAGAAESSFVNGARRPRSSESDAEDAASVDSSRDSGSAARDYRVRSLPYEADFAVHRRRRTHSRTIYTAGRPPWYNSSGQLKEPFVIGVCGGSASGKTSVAKKIIEALDVPWVSLLSIDSFYKNLTPQEHELASQNMYNFDHPKAFDFDLIINTVQRLKEGKNVEIPVYNFQTHSREKHKRNVYGANVIIVEGIFTFVNKDLLKMLDMRVFVDTDSDVRLARRLARDIAHRGRDLEGALQQYHTFVKPAFENFISQTMALADLVIPRGAENDVACDLIVQHVHTQLKQRGFKMRKELAQTNHGQPLPSSLHILKPTPQVKGLHTLIRNRETPRDEFIFYSNRLMRLLTEYTLSLLPFKTVTVDTPQGIQYEGKRMNTKRICAVSILRAGETMERAVCEVVKEVALGKILIQTNEDSGEPELLYLRLPGDIHQYQVLLLDSTVATGAAAMMAIRVLRDHEVPESNIHLLCLLMAESGVHSVAYAFPEVDIVTSAVDKEINDNYHIVPGIGNFGDRYFGTERPPSEEEEEGAPPVNPNTTL